MSYPTLIFGTGLLGISFATTRELESLLQFLKEQGINYIDTARRYPAIHPGRAETLLGDVKAAEQGFKIDTKIAINLAEGINGSLSATKIPASIAQSFEALGVKQARSHFLILDKYPTTPLQETVAAFDAAYKKGHFKKQGISNYDSAKIEEWVQLSNDNGYVKPSVFQGQYNLLCRRCEQELFPTLRKHGMVFNAWSPLAGGFLTGKATAGQRSGTRFEPGNPMGASHTNWYDKPVMHDAVIKLQAAVEPLGLTLMDVSMRWIFYHSVLREGDGVIIGGSTFEQIGANVANVKKGPLPESVVKVVDEVWEMVKGEAP